ncbi:MULTISPECIES: hypothetical protein [unclassified Streptomyces]|uniref:hypothetical protein n=1 Tax=unclassified Streptomyces TaxID=2593676 RepID=UPI00332ADCE4
MTIQPGQIYRSLSNRHHPVDGPTRIKVVGAPIAIPGVWGYGKVEVVTVTRTGREVRRRGIEASQLHATAITRDGQPRRNGYVLEGPAGRCRCHNRDGLAAEQHENDCPLGTQPDGSDR